ncbi:Tetrahydroberberine oxidase [Bertholletia excelsa]
MNTTNNEHFILLHSATENEYSNGFIAIAFNSLLSISCGSIAHPHEDFLQCLSLHFPDSLSISKVTCTPQNSSYTSNLQSETRNPRFRKPTTPKPIVIITPLEEVHIQDSIYRAKEHGLEMRVRRRGHDYEGLSYLSYQGPLALVDLINFRSIAADVENGTARVQAGAAIGELYYRIAEKSRTLGFTAVVCITVGVGGHFTGGAYSMISRKHGSAADNIIHARLVDVNGKILDRNLMGEDFFWAIRGGGAASFGLVLAWQIKLNKRALDANASKFVYRWQHVADKIDENLMIRLHLLKVNSGTYGKTTSLAVFKSLFLGIADELVVVMQESFPELGLVRADCTEMFESVLYFAGLLHFLVTRKAKSDYVTEPISEIVFKQIWKKIIGLKVDLFQLICVPFGGSLNQIPESETPFPHNIHYLSNWEEEGPNAERKHLRLIRIFYNFMAPYVSKNPRTAYFHYRDLDLGMNSRSYEQASIWGHKYF